MMPLLKTISHPSVTRVSDLKESIDRIHNLLCGIRGRCAITLFFHLAESIIFLPEQPTFIEDLIAILLVLQRMLSLHGASETRGELDYPVQVFGEMISHWEGKQMHVVLSSRAF